MHIPILVFKKTNFNFSSPTIVFGEVYTKTKIQIPVSEYSHGVWRVLPHSSTDSRTRWIV